jgi:molybdate transport repressor ModE-like protein
MKPVIIPESGDRSSDGDAPDHRELKNDDSRPSEALEKTGNPLYLKVEIGLDFNGHYISAEAMALLEQLEIHGSITGASKATGIGYRHAWAKLQALNKIFASPLFEAKEGGNQRRNAWLTSNGIQALSLYKDVTREVRNSLIDKGTLFGMQPSAAATDLIVADLKSGPTKKKKRGRVPRKP